MGQGRGAIRDSQCYYYYCVTKFAKFPANSHMRCVKLLIQ
jgi:hypothetical protein